MTAPMTTLRIERVGTPALSADLMGSSSATFQLLDGSYAPVIPADADAPLGTLGGYQDVQEEITVNVYGTSQAACYANLRTLAQLLASARRWQDETTPAPTSAARIDLVIQPQGSAEAAPLRGVLIDAEPLETPATWHDLTGAYTIENVKLRYTRRILIRDESAYETLNFGALFAGTISTEEWTDGTFVETLSPMQFALRMAATSGTRATMPPGYIILSSSAYVTPIFVQRGIDFWQSGAPWSQVNDSASYTLYTQVLRYTPDSIGMTNTAFYDIIGGAARTYTVMAKLRPSDGSRTWTARLVAKDAAGTVFPMAEAQTLEQTNTVQIVNFGQITTAANLLSFALQYTTSATGGSLDLESVVFVDMTEPTTAILPIAESTLQSSYGGTITNGQWWLTPDARMWENYGFSASLLDCPVTADTTSRGTGVYALWYATDSTHGLNWNPVSSTGDALTGAWTFTRARAYLTPE